MKLSQQNIFTLRIIGFVLMIGLMVLLNDQQETARVKAGKKEQRTLLDDYNRSGITPGNATIPARTEGALPLRLIYKPNSNFLLVINNCQQFSHVVKYQLQQKIFLGICTKIKFNFITEYLATIRNKDYK